LSPAGVLQAVSQLSWNGRREDDMQSFEEGSVEKDESRHPGRFSYEST